MGAIDGALATLNDLLVAHGPLLLAGVTVVLAIGTLAVAVSRHAIQRQRLAELALIGAAAWSLLAIVPLPRLELMESIAATGDRWVERRGAPGGDDGADTPGALAEPHARAASPTQTILAPRSAARMPQRSTAGLSASSPPQRVPPVAPPSRAAPPLDWAGILAASYLSGTLLAGVFLALSGILLLRIRWRSTAAPAWLGELLQTIPIPSRGVQIRVAELPCRPFCVGVGRGTIVLPSGLCADHRPERLRPVLLHELAHLQRRDGRGQLLFAALLPLLYFHPLYWWLRRERRLAAELLADDQAAAHLSRSEYARRLIDLAEGDLTRSILPLGAQPMLRSPSEFYWRINMLMKRREPLMMRQSRMRRSLQLAATALTIIAMTVLVGVEPAPAQGAQSLEQKALRAEREILRARVVELEKIVALLQSELDRLLGKEAEQAPEEAADPSQGDTIEVVVREGDTLSSLLARQFGDAERLEEVMRLNPGLRSRNLVVGEAVLLPHDGQIRWATDEEPSSWHLLTPKTTEEPILDLATLDLVTRAIELDGEMELTRRRLTLLHEQFVVPGVLERVELEISLKTLERKSALVRRLIEGEIRTTEAELESQRLTLKDWPTASLRIKIARLEHRIEALRSAL